VTRERAKVDRIACPWLISRFVDSEPEFLFVRKEEVQTVAESTGAIPFDVEGAELGHHGEECSFDAIIRKYGLKDPALGLLAMIVRGADTPMSEPPSESAGLAAYADGFRTIAKDDEDNMRLQFPAYDALYAHCQNQVRLKER
jgi:hypothetical protein